MTRFNSFLFSGLTTAMFCATLHADNSGRTNMLVYPAAVLTAPAPAVTAQ